MVVYRQRAMAGKAHSCTKIDSGEKETSYE